MAADQSEQHPAKVRYHSLDALRAWAMSMGIVLHAAWIMTPGDSGAPKTDASASQVMDYLAGSIHMFRMQLFFVLAGFFACLLVRKRGDWKFSWNRTLRIGLPLILFWIVLRPPMQTQFFAAQLQSGALQSHETAWELTQKAYAALTPATVFTMHLWFIYYLCLTYSIVLVGRALLAAIDRHSTFRNVLSNGFGRLLVRPWAVVPLACLTGIFILPMDGFFGIQIDAFSLYPVWSGLLSYVAYFLVGWLIFRNVHLLSDMLRGWKWQLGVGLLMTLVYFSFSNYVMRRGYQTAQYPSLSVHDMHFDHATDKPLYPEFRAKLLDAKPGSTAYATWKLLPIENQDFLKQHPFATENQIQGLMTVLSKSVLGSTEFTTLAEPIPESELSPQALQIRNKSIGERADSETLRLNRELLQHAFAGVIWSQDRNRPYYLPIRVAYSLLYSLATWLLIFGCIGFSQTYFSAHSRFWRYFSDASYWMYLMHLLVQFQILLWVGDQPWHWALKFSLYVFGTSAVLVPTYHLLVRPTWLGWLLNGRTYAVWRGSVSCANPEPTVAPEVAPASSL